MPPISERALRENVRFQAAVPLILETGGGSNACFTRTISQGGMFVVTRVRAPLDATVAITLVREGQRLRSSARVVNAAPDGLGLRFVNPGPTFGQGIAALIGELRQKTTAGPTRGAETSQTVGWVRPSDGKRWRWWRTGPRKARLLGLSLDGAALESRSRPEVGERLLIVLNPGDAADAHLASEAVVARLVDPAGFAVRFVEPSIEFRRKVSELRQQRGFEG